MDGVVKVEDWYLQALDQAIDGIVNIDKSNCVTFMNKAAERIWGINRSAVLGRNVNMLVPAGIRADHDRMVNRNRTTGEDRIVGDQRDMQMERIDGSLMWVTLSISKVILPNGDIQYTAFIKDISRQREALKAAEEAIQLVTEATEKIGTSGATVNDLAERTNLLAINAAIEAARAGERGRAFGIVAGEVKRLAENTRKAATEVSAIVDQNRKALNDVAATLQSLR